MATKAYLGFCFVKRLGVLLLPLDGMLVHCKSLPLNLLGFPNNLPVPIYTPGPGCSKTGQRYPPDKSLSSG